jgi:hypothetical protein
LFGGFVDVHVRHLITARSARQCAPTRGLATDRNDPDWEIVFT